MKKHLVKANKVKSIKSNKTYETFREGVMERPEANPDCLAETSSMFIPTDPDLSESVRVLVAKARKELTPMAFNIFSLVTGLDGREPLTIRETALKIGASPTSVQRAWESIRTRLQMWSVSDSPNER